MTETLIVENPYCNCNIDYLVSEQYEQDSGDSYYYNITKDGKKICGICAKEITEDRYYRIKKLLKVRVAETIIQWYRQGKPIPKEKYMQAKEALIDLEADLKNT